MRYKYIAIIGAFVISVVFTLAILMYYFNQNECPQGTFLCANTTVCITQRLWCNGEPDCLYEDDEVDCVDVRGFNDWIRRTLTRKSPSAICDNSNAPSQCTYINCYVNCSGLSYIPGTFSPNVTVLNFTSNFVRYVPDTVLINYTKLHIFNLDHNNISILEDKCFINQKELVFLMLQNNNLVEIYPGQFVGLSKLDTLRLDNNQLIRADFADFENTSIYWINLNHNFLEESSLKFPNLPSLSELDLSYNLLKSIPPDLFDGLSQLRCLTLEENQIYVIDSFSFQRTGQLIELVLSYNKIDEIAPDAFKSLVNLTKLSIGNNPIINLPTNLFDELKNLQSLGVEDIDIDHAEKNMFNSFPNLTFIYFKKFYYCTTYAPKVRKCYPASDGVSSLTDLLGKEVLRVAVWGISSVTFLGNLLVIWERFTAKDENPILSIVIRNLALSDMLMGIYLFVIAFEDLRYRDSYNFYANSWMSSEFCIFIGVLAMTSSEVSVMILSFLSVERFILITAPLKRNHFMTSRIASTVMINIWTVGVTLALIPAIHWKNSTRFYGANGMCFPLHIDDPFFIGWEYSAFIFLGLNLLGLLIIIYVYFSMFVSICKTRSATPLSIGDSEFALRFFLIIFTNLLCWAPIIVLKVLALMNYPAPSDIHAWIVVFILPINSAVNPLLYTFTTPKFRERMNKGCLNFRKSYVSRQQSTQESSQVTNPTVGDKLPLPMINQKHSEGTAEDHRDCYNNKYSETN